MADERTPNINLILPEFEKRFYHDELWANFRVIDSLINKIISSNSIKGLWTNATIYTVGDVVTDEVSGLLYKCVVAHTSAAIPSLFSADRTNNPTYWIDFTIEQRFRGAWDSSVNYTTGDFVIPQTGQYVICLVDHTSGATFAADDALGYWETLIDLSADIAGVESDLSATEADLSGTEGDITATEADLTSTEADAATTEGDAAATESDLTAIEADALAVEGDASTTAAAASSAESDAVAIESDYAAVESDLSAVEADLAAVEADAATVEGKLIADDDTDTSVETERTADDDIIRFKAGGIDVAEISATGTIIQTDGSTNAQLQFKDTNGAVSDVNAAIVVNLTDTGDGTEDADVTYSAQIAGVMTDYMQWKPLNGALFVKDYIYRMGDGGTGLGFYTDDRSVLLAGNVDIARASWFGLSGNFAVNENALNIDFRVKDDFGNLAIFSDASTGLTTINLVRTWIKLLTVEAVEDGDYVALRSVPEGFDIVNIKSECESGSCTATTKINTTALGGTANSVSSTADTQAHASANTTAADDDIIVTVSSNSSCTNMTLWAEIEGSI